MKYILLTLAVAVVVMMGEKVARGIRNNNPGNIRENGTQWKGRIGDDGAFVIFDSPENGIRAMVRILKSYSGRGVDTLKNIIATWAPSTENNTESYIKSVEQRTGIKAGEVVTVDKYPSLIAAIIHHENGSQPYSMNTIIAGVNAA